MESTQKEMYIYLCGYINSYVMDECTSWRKRIRSFYEDYKGARYPCSFIDPINGEDLSKIKDGGLKSNIPVNMIVHRDYNSVKNCDLIVANLDTFGQIRPPIGSLIEIGWGWQFHKPIILISSEHMYKDHPFLSYMVSYVVESVEELLEKKLINTIYKSTVSANY